VERGARGVPEVDPAASPEAEGLGVLGSRKVYEESGLGGEGPRGWTDIARSATGKLLTTIGLTPRADLSTFLHEMGHVYLEVMGDLAEREGASQRARDDYATLLKWFGVSSRAEIRREHHEKFARGFERYLMEARAPSVDLAGVFERFATWLKRIYRDFAALNVELSDEVRDVFDRMFATDQQIAAARQRAGAEPYARRPDWMDDADWAKYQEIVEAADRAVRQKAQVALLKKRQREYEQWWKEEELEEIDRAGEEYERLRETHTWRYLRFSELGGQKLDKPLRLDRAQVERIVGKENAKRLHGVLVKKGGEDIDAPGMPTSTRSAGRSRAASSGCSTRGRG
jgi:hypothetical protein